MVPFIPNIGSLRCLEVNNLHIASQKLTCPFDDFFAGVLWTETIS